MAEGKSTISFEGDASGLKAASQEAVQSLQNVEAAAKKADQAVSGGQSQKSPSKAFEGVGTSKLGDQSQAIGEVKEWAESVKVAGAASDTAAAAAGKLGAGMAGSAAGAGVLRGALAAAAAEAGGFSGILIRLASKIHPIAAAAVIAAAATYKLVDSWIKGRFAAVELAAKLNTLQISWKQYLDGIVNPPGDLLATFKQIDAATEEQKKKNREATDKAIEDGANKARAEEDLINKQNSLDADNERTKRQLVAQAEKKKTEDRIAAETERMNAVNKASDEAAERKRDRTEENLKAEQDLEIALIEATGNKAQALEQEWARETTRLMNESKDAERVGDTETFASKERQIVLLADLYKEKIGKAQQEIDDEADAESKRRQDEIDRKEKEIKDLAQKRYEAERDADKKLHDERMKQMEELRGDRQGDLGGVSYINSGRDAIWMNGGGGR